MGITIQEVQQSDIPSVVKLLSEMQTEIGELDVNPDVYAKAIAEGLRDNLSWFLFLDEQKNCFGTCYLQPVHNYWRLEKRFYLGGFYISPLYRGKGNFRKIYNILKSWVVSKNGGQIYAHIHNENERSMRAFKAVGLEEIEYKLFADYWEN